MRDLFDILTGESLSLIVKKEEKIYKYKNRGVADLYDIICSGSGILNGAVVADKIVGKGAAALMVIGGVSSLITSTISSSALELLERNNIKVVYLKVVDHIINRAGTDWCPIEKMCRDENDLDCMFNKIDAFVKGMR